MDGIQHGNVDLSTREAAERVVADIRTRVKDLEDRNTDLKAQVGKMATDLTAAQQSLAEAQNRAGMEAGADGPETELRAYVDEDEGTVRMRSAETADGDVLPGLLDSTPVCEWQRELQDLAEKRMWVRLIRKPTSRANAYGPSPKCDRAIERHLARAPAALKRIWADSANIGAEFVPDLLTPAFAEELTAARRVEALFQTMNMPGKELRLPFLGLDTTPYLKSVPTSADPAKRTETSVPTDQRSITAVSLAVRSQMDEDAVEDSITATVPILRARVIKALVDAKEDAIINGDTTGVHQDNDLTAWNPAGRWNAANLAGTDDHRRAWIGLRARAFDTAQAADGNALQTFAGFQSARANLDAPHGLSDLVCIVSIEHYIANFLQLTQVVTVDQYGPNATVLTGELAQLGGIPVIPSQFMTQDLNASGLFDNITTTQGSYIIVDTSRFMMGVLRSNTVEVDKDITRGVVDVVSTWRGRFFTVDPAASVGNVSLRFNLD